MSEQQQPDIYLRQTHLVRIVKQLLSFCVQYLVIHMIYVWKGWESRITWVCSDVVQVQCLLGAIKTFCHALLWKINSQHKKPHQDRSLRWGLTAKCEMKETILNESWVFKMNPETPEKCVLEKILPSNSYYSDHITLFWKVISTSVKLRAKLTMKWCMKLTDEPHCQNCALLY